MRESCQLSSQSGKMGQSIILRPFKYEAIRKGNKAAAEKSTKATVLFPSSYSSKSGSLRAPKGTCTYPECIKKGITSHFTDHCFFKYLGLRRPKYTLQQITPKGSNKNLRSENSPSPTPTTPKPGEPSIREEWQPKILASKGPWTASWLVTSPYATIETS